MKIQAVAFDMDDTLYKRSQPFLRACDEVLSPLFSLDWMRLYELRAAYGEEVFEASQKGEMSMNDMYVYRLGRALRDLGQSVPDGTIFRFEERYSWFQSRISLDPEMRDVLTWLKEKDILTGLITNGPSEHQRVKIRALGLGEWIPEKYWCISGEAGVVKPRPGIFHIAEKMLGVSGEDSLYIGDHFASDIEGASGAGWHTVWFNPGHRERPEGSSVLPDQELSSGRELLDYLKTLFQDL